MADPINNLKTFFLELAAQYKLISQERLAFFKLQTEFLEATPLLKRLEEALQKGQNANFNPAELVVLKNTLNACKVYALAANGLVKMGQQLVSPKTYQQAQACIRNYGQHILNLEQGLQAPNPAPMVQVVLSPTLQALKTQIEGVEIDIANAEKAYSLKSFTNFSATPADEKALDQHVAALDTKMLLLLQVMKTFAKTTNPSAEDIVFNQDCNKKKEGLGLFVNKLRKTKSNCASILKKQNPATLKTYTPIAGQVWDTTAAYKNELVTLKGKQNPTSADTNRMQFCELAVKKLEKWEERQNDLLASKQVVINMLTPAQKQQYITNKQMSNQTFGVCLKNAAGEWQVCVDASKSPQDIASTIVHEMTHLQQVKRGDLFFANANLNGTTKEGGMALFYDQTDEIEAFEAEFFVNPLANTIFQIHSLVDIPIYVQKAYAHLPPMPLNKSSTIKEIYDANKKAGGDCQLQANFLQKIIVKDMGKIWNAKVENAKFEGFFHENALTAGDDIQGNKNADSLKKIMTSMYGVWE